MLELENAVERILAQVLPAKPEIIPLAEAQGRILAETIVSPVDLPGFDNSAMDGYAVRAANLSAANTRTPASARLVGRVAAGDIFDGEVRDGECVRVFTGSAMPPGADAVVIQEDTQPHPEKPELVSFLDAPKPWENVRFRGEDVKRGAIIVRAGEEITAGRIGLLGAVGITNVQAGRRPVVGLLATGSELIEGGAQPAPGKIFESNRLMLAALAARAGAIPRIFPLVPDTAADTRRALETAFAECDLVVSSGGVSVGEMDFVKTAFADLGGEMDFWKVAIRPGRPFVFGQWQAKFLFGLPGNPVSAFVTFLLLVRPALRRWQGAAEIGLPTRAAVLADTLTNPGGRRHFMRVITDVRGQTHSSGANGSHLLGSLARANGLVDVPAGQTIPAGATVTVLQWERPA